MRPLRSLVLGTVPAAGLYTAGVLAWLRARPGRLDALLAVGGGGPVAALSLCMAFLAVPAPRAALLGVSLLAAHAALAVRRTRPLASFVVVCAAFAAQTAVTGGFLGLPSTVVFPLALYSFCAYGNRRAPVLGLVAGAAGAVVVTIRFVLDSSVVAANLRPNPLIVFAVLFAVILAAWSLGLFRRTHLAYLAMLEERIRHTEAERAERDRQAVVHERTRIAREMHDVIAHSLAVIVSQAKGGRFAAQADPARAAEVLATIEETGRHALTDMRGLLGVLRTDAGPHDGERQGPQPTLRDLPELLDRVRAAGLPVRHSERGTPRQLSPAAELAVFRTVQEALTNTIKHAGIGTRADVTFTWTPEGLTVIVRDDGPGSSDTSSGHGLIGMRERLTAVGGSVSAGPGASGGFQVTARLP